MQDTILGLSTWKTAQSGKTLLEQTTVRSRYLSFAVKAYDKALRADKKTSSRIFCGVVDGIIPFARLRRVLSKDVSYQMRALRLLSGDFTSSNGEAVKNLLMTHFPDCQPIEEHHSSGRVLQEPPQEDWDLT
jgi:hypothetical protein